ncbi:TetR/AcrR family transcriptional regulator [Rhodococcus sp. USK10]|uniref:TetR/AcrR family transcriptional regulator n=1 Tax=Rhodococcus sp. USK10 TaxID=2789739 RepID=UPI001C5D87AB|nr:TetR/AcrR family transcriptional regulator [Rhodococcus sp. USK10]QYB03366.1 TetR/AcrR family transcriptional regulator [Rhodococcus sp. USK10]
MLNRLPADERRAQLVESALAIAEQRGVASVTVRAVAEEAGVSLGVVHYCFESKEELLAAMGESLVLQLSASMRLAFGQVRHAPDLRGIDGLRELLHIGISGMWPIIEATPDRQLLTYEITAQALRHRASGSERAGDIAGQQYRTMDEEAIEFLAECARIAGVSWGTPVEAIARFGLAMLDGLVLRWLVDRDSEAMIAALDEMVQVITAKAVEQA